MTIPPTNSRFVTDPERLRMLLAERFARGSDRVIGRNSSAKRRITYEMGGSSGTMGNPGRQGGA